MRIAYAQNNFIVGDIAGNEQKILATIRSAAPANDLILFPELAVTGYPPEDLLLRPEFLQAAANATERIIAATSDGATVVFGTPLPYSGETLSRDSEPRLARNAAVVAKDGHLVATYYKRLLPNYGVFDEGRYFVPGDEDPPVFTVAGVRTAVLICEDIWTPENPRRLAKAGAKLIASINASPYSVGKRRDRINVVRRAAVQNKVDVAYVNTYGGQDELVFDGGALFVDANGVVRYNYSPFTNGERHLVTWASGEMSPDVETPCTEEEVWKALVLALRDYVEKNGASNRVTIGLSGGIDSALTAAIAVEALGADAVHGYTMPSEYSSDGSVNDSFALANNLGITCREMAIGGLVSDALVVLEDDVERGGVAEENLQARIRGLLLMAVANHQGGLVLATGNKSEMSVGYATLYGDMAGGYAILKDVPKTLVYRIAQWLNKDKEIIPWNTIEKPPSAELAPGQEDTDSLPAYDVLDDILERYIERHQSPAEIVTETTYDPGVIYDVIRKVDRNEYKRRQAAPGVKITPRAFGKDRRLPIVNGWTA